MRESETPSTTIETVIAKTKVETPIVFDETAEQTSQAEDRGYVREQLFRAQTLEDTLTRILVSEYMKAEDTKLASELIQRTKTEREMREGSTKEVLRIRDRKDADLARSNALDQELALIPDDGNAENRQARMEKEEESIEVRTLRSEVQKIEISSAQSGEKIEAVFKPQDGESHIKDGASDLGTLTNHIPRGHLREWLAGFVAKACGVERVVPPTVIREVDGRVGSVQAWAKGDLASKHLDWAQKAQEADMEAIALIDYILDNADRHPANFLINDDDRAFAIDHGAILSLKKENGKLRSFPLRAVSGKPISPEMVAQMRKFADSETRMKALEEAFTFVLAEDAGPKFAQFKQRVKELAGNEKFPEYTLNYQEDEVRFASKEGGEGDAGDKEVKTPKTEIKSRSETPPTVVQKKQKVA